MTRASHWRSARALVAASAVAGVVVAGFLLLDASPVAPVHVEASGRSASQQHTTPSPTTRLSVASAASAPSTDDTAEAQANGRRAVVIDAPAELDAAERAYAQRIYDNLDHLEASAEAARSEGNDQRAALMEKRIAHLELRLDESGIERHASVE